MTYTAIEESQELGKPVILYEISIGTSVFRYTSGEDDFTFSANNYTTLAITHGNLNAAPLDRGNPVTISLPASNEFAQLYINNVPGLRASLTIIRTHRTDIDMQSRVLFKGFVRSVAYTNFGNRAEIAVIPISSSIGREVPRFTYQSPCNHVLYDAGCKVATSGFQVTSTVQGVSGRTLTIDALAAQADGFYTSGFISFGTDFRVIYEHTGNTITLPIAFRESPLNQTVNVFAGCAHNTDDCKNKFDNIINYGGFPFVPLRNVFSEGVS